MRKKSQYFFFLVGQGSKKTNFTMKNFKNIILKNSFYQSTKIQNHIFEANKNSKTHFFDTQKHKKTFLRSTKTQKHNLQTNKNTKTHFFEKQKNKYSKNQNTKKQIHKKHKNKNTNKQSHKYILIRKMFDEREKKKDLIPC